jgi:hypothetical protein
MVFLHYLPLKSPMWMFFLPDMKNKGLGPVPSLGRRQ